MSNNHVIRDGYKTQLTSRLPVKIYTSKGARNFPTFSEPKVNVGKITSNLARFSAVINTNIFDTKAAQQHIATYFNKSAKGKAFEWTR